MSTAPHYEFPDIDTEVVSNPSPVIPLPASVGEFILQERLAKGGMGEVWRAYHRKQRIPVAVKVLSKMAHSRSRRLFQQEIEAIAALRHPFIVEPLSCGEISSSTTLLTQGELPEGSPWFAMPLAGGSLADVLAPKYDGPIELTWAETRRVLEQLLEGLAHAHARGFVHRDIKPGNLLHYGDELDVAWRLADFGVTHLFDDDKSHGSPMAGTPQYMAPEQFAGMLRWLGPWTDLYAVGCVGYEMTTGRALFVRPDADIDALAVAHLQEAIPRIRPRFSVPTGFEAWLRRLLEKHPQDRFQRASEALWALRELGGPDTARIAKCSDLDGVPWPKKVPPMPNTWRTQHDHEPRRARMFNVGQKLAPRRRLPTVGRELERDLLWSALCDCVDTGAPGAVVLSGPVGVGKSHLARWLAETTHELGAGRNLTATHGRQMPHTQALSRMVARFLRCTGLSRPSRAVIVRDLLRWLGADIDMTSGVEELIAQGLDDEGPNEATSSRAGERYALIGRLLAQACQERPVVVWLDDVQWGCDALAFAIHMLQQPPSGRFPVLFVLTVEDQALAEEPAAAELLELLSENRACKTMEIGPLAQRECVQLVSSLLRLESELARSVAERSGGHPLFAMELVCDWVERGLLRPSPRGFTLDDNDIALPETLLRACSERLERALSDQVPGDRAMLEMAAVLGHEVDLDEWKRACRIVNIGWSQRLLDHLTAARLVVPTDVGVAFAHGVVRETLLECIDDDGKLKRYHAAVAAVLAHRVRKGVRRGICERLAQHVYAAGQVESAVDVMLQAVTDRCEAGDHRTGGSLLRTVRQWVEETQLPPADCRVMRHDMLSAKVLMEGGAYVPAREVARSAASMARRCSETELLVESLLVLGRVELRCYRPKEAEAHLREAETVLAQYGHHIPKTRARALEARLLHAEANSAHQRGDLRRAGDAYREALDLFKRIGEKRLVPPVVADAAGLGIQSGDFAQAERLFERARRGFSDNGDRFGVARCINGLAELDRRRGDYPRAEQRYNEALSIWDEMRSPAAPFGRLNLALTLLAQGRTRNACELAQRACTELEPVGQAAAAATAHAVLVACAAARLDWCAWDDHMARVEKALGDASAFDPDDAWALTLAGDATHRAGQTQRAVRAWRFARKIYDNLGRNDDARDLGQRLRGSR